MGKKTVYLTIGAMAAGVLLVPLASMMLDDRAASVETLVVVPADSKSPLTSNNVPLASEPAVIVSHTSADAAAEALPELTQRLNDSEVFESSELQTLDLQLINPETGDETNLSIKLRQAANQRRWPHNVYTPGNLGTPPEPGSAYQSSWN